MHMHVQIELVVTNFASYSVSLRCVCPAILHVDTEVSTASITTNCMHRADVPSELRIPRISPLAQAKRTPPQILNKLWFP
jgi:hypothetical protein